MFPIRHIFVLSIRVPRRRKARKRFAEIRRLVHSWQGVDGRQLNKQKLIEQKIIHPSCSLKMGQIGCFLAHKNAWEQAVKHQYKQTLILEDDATLTINPRKTQRIRNALMKLEGKSWDILLLSRNDRRMYNRSNITPGLVIPRFWCGLFCYVVSLQGARKLLQLNEVKKIGNVPVDTVLSHNGVMNRIKIIALKTNLCTYFRLGSDTRGIK